MGSCFRGKRKSNFLWWALISATFVFCSLLIYYIIIYKDITCLLQSGCLQMKQPRTENFQAENCRKVCETIECLKFSSRIFSNMDPRAEQCDDFYQFVCGKYKEKHEGAGNYSTVGDMLEDLYSTLKVMIDTSNWPEESAMNKVKVVFDSCMNPGSSDVRSIQDLLDFLELIGFPKWPRLDENFAFLQTPLYEILGKLISFNQYVFFEFSGSFPDDISTGRLLNLTFSPASMWRISEKLTSKLGRNALMAILLHLGLDIESSEEMTDSFFLIEKERKELISNASEAKCTEEKIILNCMEENSPNMMKLCNLMESIIRNGMVETLYDKNQLEMRCDDYHYAEGLQNIIEKHGDRDIANYIAIMVFFHNVKDLDFSLSVKLQSFFKTDIHDDFSTNLNKQKKCIYWLTKNMHYPMGAMYIDKLFPNAVAEQVDDLIKKFINATTELFLQQSWLDGHSKHELAKGVSSLANSLKKRVEDMQNLTEINSIFEMFKPTRSSFISNSLLLQKNRFTQMLTSQERMLVLMRDNTFEVNAYGGYDIFLAFGFLTPPLFHHGHPDLLNYAGIGHIVGHEIGHFFFFNIESQSINATNQTLDSYLEKAKCLIDQYSTFKLKKIQKNLLGNATIFENIPDNLGVKTMEIVSEKYMENAIDDITLPGLSYSPEQLLYIAMGQAWCAAHDAGKENHFYSVNPHSPQEYRVIGTLQNSPRFSEVFRCSKTSYMNAEKKCIMFE